MKPETLKYLARHLSEKELDIFEENLLKQDIDSRDIVSVFFNKSSKTVLCLLKNGKDVEIQIKKA